MLSRRARWPPSSLPRGWDRGRSGVRTTVVSERALLGSGLRLAVPRCPLLVA